MRGNRRWTARLNSAWSGLWGTSIVAPLALAVGFVAACGSDSGQPDAHGGRPILTTSRGVKQALQKGDAIVLTLATSTPAAALNALASMGTPTLKSSSRFVNLQATDAPLATALDQGSRAETLVEFLRQYGAVLVPPGEPAPAAPIELLMAKAPVSYKRGNVSGVVIFLRQRFGLFDNEDLLGGVFVANDLVSVAGTLRDPASSPALTKSLSVTTKEVARDRFALKLGLTSPAADLPIRAFIRYQEKQVIWVLGTQVLNAETGDLLPPIDPGVHDDFSSQKEASQ